MKHDGWNVVDDAIGVLWREYRFGKGGKATTLVFRGAGGLCVVSPATELEARDYDALSEFGEVTALVANNPLHNLGQKPWRERFPDAKSYCPASSKASLEKKVRGVTFHPLTELALGPDARCEAMPGSRGGETFASVKTDKGHVWYTGDILTNVQKLPPPPIRWLFTWTDSGPGYRLFKPNAWLFVKDGAALRSFMEARLADAPPTLVVPAHGPAFEDPDLGALTAAQLARL